MHPIVIALVYAFSHRSGPAETELRELSAKSSGALRLLGQLPPLGVRDALWAADAFVLNTRRAQAMNPCGLRTEPACASLQKIRRPAESNPQQLNPNQWEDSSMAAPFDDVVRLVSSGAAAQFSK